MVGAKEMSGPYPTECTCVCHHYGDHTNPPEWEQNPACPQHPDVPWLVDSYLKAAVRIKKLEAEISRLHRQIDWYKEEMS